MEWHGKGLDQESEHGKKICSSFKSNEVIKIKSNRKSRNKSEKFSKKESSEIQDVTQLVECTHCQCQLLRDQQLQLSCRNPDAGLYNPIVHLLLDQGSCGDYVQLPLELRGHVL